MRLAWQGRCRKVGMGGSYDHPGDTRGSSLFPLVLMSAEHSRVRAAPQGV